MFVENGGPFLLLLLAALRIGITYGVVEVVEGSRTWNEQRAEWVVVKQRIQSFLMQRVDIDVGGNGVALCFSMRQPGLDNASNTRVMDPMAPFAKRTEARKSHITEEDNVL